MIKRLDEKETGEIDCEQFLEIMAERMDDGTEDEELIEAFKMFGPSTEYEGISLKMLKEALKRDGEHLEDEEVDFIFDYVDVDQDRLIGIKDFLLMMMAK